MLVSGRVVGEYMCHFYRSSHGGPSLWVFAKNGVQGDSSKLYQIIRETLVQWLFLVPLKGGIGSIFHPPEGKDYKWYIYKW